MVVIPHSADVQKAYLSRILASGIQDALARAVADWSVIWPIAFNLFFNWVVHIA